MEAPRGWKLRVGGGRGGLFFREGDIRDTEAPRFLQRTHLPLVPRAWQHHRLLC